MICVLQNYTAMIASTFYIAQCNETIKMLYAQPLLMINNIAQKCLSGDVFSRITLQLLQVHSHTAVRIVQHLIAICTTIAYDKQYCTNVGVYRIITLQLLQVHSHMVISVCNRLLYAQRMLMINNIAQMYLS